MSWLQCLTNTIQFIRLSISQSSDRKHANDTNENQAQHQKFSFAFFSPIPVIQFPFPGQHQIVSTQFFKRFPLNLIKCQRLFCVLLYILHPKRQPSGSSTDIIIAFHLPISSYFVHFIFRTMNAASGSQFLEQRYFVVLLLLQHHIALLILLPFHSHTNQPTKQPVHAQFSTVPKFKRELEFGQGMLLYPNEFIIIQLT